MSVHSRRVQRSVDSPGKSGSRTSGHYDTDDNRTAPFERQSNWKDYETSKLANGFDLDLFIDTPPESVLCKLCELVMRDPYKLQCCYKTMCKECFETSDSISKCPFCAEEDNDSGVIVSKVQKVIKNLKVKCSVQGCHWQGKLADLDEHTHIMEQPLSRTDRLPSIEPACSPAPHDLTATCVHDSNNSIKLSWKKPEGIDAIDEYAVLFCFADDIANWMEYDERVYTESIVLKNLKPGETYFFRVKANYDGKEVLSKPTTLVELPVICNSPILTGKRPSASLPLAELSESKNLKPSDRIVNKPHQTSRGKLHVTAPKAVPGCPESPKVADTQSDKILLKWKEPKMNAELVYQYIVSIQQERGDNIPEYLQTGSSNTVFEITGLMPKTNYTFQIYAETTEGIKSTLSKTLQSTTKSLMPGEPIKPEAAKIYTNQILLQWRKPKKFSENVESYKVSCYKASSGKPTDKFFEMEKILDTKCYIKNLSPKSRYIFSVRAISDNRETDEVYSDPIKTKGDHVSLPPRFLNIEKKEATSVYLKWDPPPNPEKVRSYLIEQRTVESSHWEEAVSMTAGATSCEVSDLTQGCGYIFRIRANTEFGVSDWTSSEKVFTTSLTSGIPGKPRYISADHNNIELDWGKPENDDFVEKYEVVCYMFSNRSEVRRSYSESNFIVFNELTPNTQYLFRVRAYCHNQSISGFSEYSNAISTAKFLPRISGKVKGKHITSSSIHLKWKLADNCDPYDVSKYMIFFAPETAPSFWEQIETADSTPEYTVNDLRPDCGYVFKVRAKSKVLREYGPDSKTSEILRTTPIVSPSPPIPKTIGSNSITLMWNAPHISSKSQKIFYRIEYMSADSYHTQYWELYPEKFHETVGTIKQLKGGANYCFRVLIYFNGKEEQLFTETQPSEWVKTKCLVPSPPGKPYALKVTQNSVFLNWEKPMRNSEYVSYYNVHVIYKGKSTLAVENIQDEAALIENLDSNTKYKFVVEAVNPDDKRATSSPGDFVATEKELPSQPGRPYMLQVTDSTVKVAWEVPKQNSAMIARYIVQYKSLDGDWRSKETQSNDTTIEVTKLQHSTKYLFQITPVTAYGEKGTSSDVSEPVETKSSLPSAPGKPKGKANSRNAITLKWDRPQQNFGTIAYYEIHYYESQQDARKAISQKRRTKGTEEETQIDKLTSEKGYYFYVEAITISGGKSPPSLISDLITNDRSLAEKFLPSCDKISKEGSTPEIYLLPKERDTSTQEGCGLNKYDIKLAAHPSVASGVLSKFRPSFRLRRNNAIQQKVLMLVGATGSGKSTLVNGMMNYIMRVQFGDHFRLKLIHEPNVSQTGSVTSEVSAYTVQNEQGFQLSYTFTLVDTPGFGDTRGIEQDKKITKQIKTFFNMKQGGIPHLDGIGFVCQAGSVRLTPTQRYIFDSIFSMFGNDVKNNIFVMCTFCDDDDPQVVQAIKEVNIPVKKFYKFNNSALYSSGTGKMTESFWEIGVENFRNFFHDFEKASPVSLTLTKQVLQEREALETIVSGLQMQIESGMSLINELTNELKVFDANKDMIEQNRNFTYQVEEDTMVETPLEPGKYTTNCMKCNMTCHYPCVFPNNEQKVNCAAMSNNRGSNDASCGVCPGNCHWSSHRNAPFRLVTERRVITKEYAETLRRFEQAKTQKLTLEKGVESMKNKIDSKFQEVFDLVVRANKCMKKLDQIAFRSNHLNDADYIQLLIDAQKTEKKPGYKDRIEHYTVLQERAKLLSQTGEFHVQAQKGGKRWWYDHFMETKKPSN